MSIKGGSICQVIGSNFKHYVIALDKSPDADYGIIAMDDTGNINYYCKTSLKFIKNVDIDKNIKEIRQALINDNDYQNNHCKSLDSKDDWLKSLILINFLKNLLKLNFLLLIDWPEVNKLITKMNDLEIDLDKFKRNKKSINITKRSKLKNFSEKNFKRLDYLINEFKINSDLDSSSSENNE